MCPSGDELLCFPCLPIIPPTALPPSLPTIMAASVRAGPPVANAGPQSQLVCCSRGAWCGAAAAVCSLRPFLLWSLLCSSHLINNDCTSHRNFPFSIFCHPPLAHPHPYHTHRPPDQQQDKWCPTTWWLATPKPASDTTARLVFQACFHDSLAVEGAESHWTSIVNWSQEWWKTMKMLTATSEQGESGELNTNIKDAIISLLAPIHYYILFQIWEHFYSSSWCVWYCHGWHVIVRFVLSLW